MKAADKCVKHLLLTVTSRLTFPSQAVHAEGTQTTPSPHLSAANSAQALTKLTLGLQDFTVVRCVIKLLNERTEKLVEPLEYGVAKLCCMLKWTVPADISPHCGPASWYNSLGVHC